MSKVKNNKNVTKKKEKPVKITWEMIYEDFKLRYPNLSKKVLRWNSVDFATIELYLYDGSKMRYNYDLQRAEFVKEEPIHISVSEK